MQADHWYHLEWIRPWYKAQLSEEQNGYRKIRGTADVIISMKRVHQISDRKKQTWYVSCVDLTAAFDCVPMLFNSIRLCFPEGENVKLLYILEKFYQKTSLTYQEPLVTFLVTSNVLQVRPESPSLFNLYIDFVMRVFMNDYTKDNSIRFFKHQYRINARSISREWRLRMCNENVKLWGSSTVPWCSYADDLILFMLHVYSLQRATTILNKVFTNYILCVNVSKTETMTLNHMLLEDE